MDKLTDEQRMSIDRINALPALKAFNKALNLRRELDDGVMAFVEGRHAATAPLWVLLHNAGIEAGSAELAARRVLDGFAAEQLEFEDLLVGA